MFVSPTNNVESKNNDVKTVLASKNIDKGKSKCLSVKTLMSKCPKKNKTYTILIFIQVYSSNFWVNFDLQKLRISKNSKLESCRYLSHGSNPSSLVSIGFLRREIRPKYWLVLKSNFSFSDSASLISFLIWSFQSWQSILALQLHLLRHLSMVL